MDVPSDDLFAEMLTKQLGARVGTGGTTRAGARVIAARVGLRPAPEIVDGSGLSRSDALLAAEIVDLLRAVWHDSDGQDPAHSLPSWA